MFGHSCTSSLHTPSPYPYGPYGHSSPLSTCSSHSNVHWASYGTIGKKPRTIACSSTPPWLSLHISYEPRHTFLGWISVPLTPLIIGVLKWTTSALTYDTYWNFIVVGVIFFIVNTLCRNAPLGIFGIVFCGVTLAFWFFFENTLAAIAMAVALLLALAIVAMLTTIAQRCSPT